MFKVVQRIHLKKLLKCNDRKLNLIVKQYQRQQRNVHNNSLLLRLSKRSMSNKPGQPQLNNKITIVTGAGGRLGRAVCQAFEKEGATVIAIDKNEDRMKQLKEKVKCETIVADCSNEDEVIEYISNIFSTHSHIDVLVNGTRMKGEMESFHKTDMNTMQKIIESNLYSSVINCKHVIPIMVQQKQGSIINVGSFLLAKMTLTGLSNLCVAKHGIIGLTRSIASEYSKHGVRCNTLSPGPIADKRIFDGMAQYCSDLLGIPKDEIAKLATNKASEGAGDQRFADVSELAQAVLFLASDESTFINSEHIHVDGGMRYRAHV